MLIKNKIVLLTGGANGLGFAYAKELLRNGAGHVSILDLTNSNGEGAMARLNVEFGKGRTSFFACDVTKPQELEESKADIEQKISAKRPNFANPKLVRNASDTSSAAETKDKKSSSAARIPMQERARRVGSLKLNKEAHNDDPPRATKSKATLKQYRHPDATATSSDTEDDPDVVDEPSVRIELGSPHNISEDSGISSSAGNTRYKGGSKPDKRRKNSSAKTSAHETIDEVDNATFASPTNTRGLKKADVSTATTPKSSKKTSAPTATALEEKTPKSSKKTSAPTAKKLASQSTAETDNAVAGCSGAAQPSAGDCGGKEKKPTEPGVPSGQQPTGSPRKTGTGSEAAEVTDDPSLNENPTERNDRLTPSDDDTLNETQMPSDLDSDTESILHQGSGILRRRDPLKKNKLEHDIDDAVEQIINNLNDLERTVSDTQGADATESDGSSASAMSSIAKLKAENKLLRMLNYRLQRNLAINHEQVEATLTTVDLETRSTVVERVRGGSDMAIGFRNLITGKMHAGFGYWIRTRDYDELRTRPALNPSKFIANIAVMIFTDATMRNSSVSGKRCNARPYKDRKRRAAKPALDTKGLDAVAALTRFWMISSTKPKYLEEDIVREVGNIRTVIAKKISDMNRPSKTKSCATESETEAPELTPNDLEDVNELEASDGQLSEEEGSDATSNEDHAEEALPSDGEDGNEDESSESRAVDVQQPQESPMDVSVTDSTVAEDEASADISAAVRQENPHEAFVEQIEQRLDSDHETDSEQSKKSNPRTGDSADEDPDEGLRVLKKPKILDG